ncbi:hypothetical protein EPA93_41055 [Ktedonosporobacter rubrisoli]|uniref:Uncharacterized protein n=1 Tax=Ktedonosporobacter rubrisoli TaxID=2509675 RepID=A0A4P6K2T8_KTERU|nr:hypothetical protein [Ktedonosporobacter rubrisoli]QBD82030.1 hypothetical protein EPA93_41055 [Ktedonosporobacter rubrisoli]
MSDIQTNIQKAFVFFLSDARLDDLRELSAVQDLLAQGALVELEPAPITSTQSLYYQAFSGRIPASFGFFDTLMPRCQLPRAQGGGDDYQVVEVNSGRDAAPRLLPDILRTVGWSVDYQESSLAELAKQVQALTAEQPASATCKIVSCTLAAGENRKALAEALASARSWVGQDGLLALLVGSQAGRVEHFVNVNNFLADMGIIERDEQTNQVNWQGSLAYYAGHGQLWINLLGRDPQGAIHPQSEFEEVTETLIKALPSKLRDSDTGATPIERIYRKEELYSGEYLFCAPDLVIQFKPGFAPSPNSSLVAFDDTLFTTPEANTTSTNGVHPSSVKGFLLASAPAFVPGRVASSTAPLIAGVPSLLHALGVEFSDVDGTAVSELFSEAYLANHPIRSGGRSQELSEEDEELVINRLRDLGYI